MKRYGSDVVVELLERAGVEHVAFNPGASFRGIHDSLVHAVSGPRIVLCTHEAVSVAIAHGYAKTAGKPMAALLHDVVGLQHASMAIYNAWCDRVAVLCLGGTGPMSKPRRRPWIDWIHTALVQGQQVRDYVKWDDQPADLASLPESFARAWTTARAAPPGPVYLCLDVTIQEDEAPAGISLDGDHPVPTSPAASSRDVAALAERLCAARLPVLLTDYAGDTESGFEALRELAELLHAPVVDHGARFCFPTRHELNFTEHEGALASADLVVCLDVEDPAGRLAQSPWSAAVPVVNVSPAHLRLRSWAHDYQPLAEAEDHLSASCDAILPDLVDAVRARGSEPAHVASRRERLAGLRAAQIDRWEAEAGGTDGGDASVASARLALELRDLLVGERWMLAHGTLEGWERRLWPFERHRHHIGWHGGGGLGYGPGAAIGAALALEPETLCVSIQPDGDLLYAPGALWTAARYRVPVLFVMHNNRQYRNTVEHAARIAGDRGRNPSRRYEGSGLDEPTVDFATLARSFGVWSAGPITREDDVAAALREAREIVRMGRPALIDVVTTGA